MAKKNFDFMVELLKDYIDNNGLPSLTANALHVYEMLKKNGDPYEAGAVYLTLLAGIPKDADKLDIDSLKEKIQRTCFFEEETAEALADMYRKVYSRENQEEWEEKANAGFKEFCSSSWKYEWEGEDRWSPYDSPHVYISYGYSVSCVLAVENLEKASEYFHLQLAKHPFLDAEEFFNILAEDLDMQIEKAFADSGEILDDYYPPSGDEFYYEDIFVNFCQSHGFRLEDFEENGYASDCYEHD